MDAYAMDDIQLAKIPRRFLGIESEGWTSFHKLFCMFQATKIINF